MALMRTRCVLLLLAATSSVVLSTASDLLSDTLQTALSLEKQDSTGVFADDNTPDAKSPGADAKSPGADAKSPEESAQSAAYDSFKDNMNTKFLSDAGFLQGFGEGQRWYDAHDHTFNHWWAFLISADEKSTYSSTVIEGKSNLKNSQPISGKGCSVTPDGDAKGVNCDNCKVFGDHCGIDNGEGSDTETKGNSQCFVYCQASSNGRHDILSKEASAKVMKDAVESTDDLVDQAVGWISHDGHRIEMPIHDELKLPGQKFPLDQELLWYQWLRTGRLNGKLVKKGSPTFTALSGVKKKLLVFACKHLTHPDTMTYMMRGGVNTYYAMTARTAPMTTYCLGKMKCNEDNAAIIETKLSAAFETSAGISFEEAYRLNYNLAFSLDIPKKDDLWMTEEQIIKNVGYLDCSGCKMDQFNAEKSPHGYAGERALKHKLAGRARPHSGEQYNRAIKHYNRQPGKNLLEAMSMQVAGDGYGEGAVVFSHDEDEKNLQGSEKKVEPLKCFPMMFAEGGPYLDENEGSMRGHWERGRPNFKGDSTWISYHYAKQSRLDLLGDSFYMVAAAKAGSPFGGIDCASPETFCFTDKQSGNIDKIVDAFVDSVEKDEATWPKKLEETKIFGGDVLPIILETSKKLVNKAQQCKASEATFYINGIKDKKWMVPGNGGHQGGCKMKVTAEQFTGLLSEKGGRGVVLHAHTGENFPQYDWGDYLKCPQSFRGYGEGCTETCEEDDKLMFGFCQKKIEQTYCTNMGKQGGHGGVQLVDRARVKSVLNGIVIKDRPTHHIGGQNNMYASARSIEKYYEKEGKDMPEWIRVRFGHCTHASWKTAKILGKYGINCDVCISSNLATSAYTWPQDLGDECKLYEQGRVGEGKKAIFGSRGWTTPYDPTDQDKDEVGDPLSYESALETVDARETCGEPGAALDLCYTWSSVADKVKSVSNVLNWMSEDCIVRGFDQHAFLSLFINKVKITFGLDASQVEHSDYLQDTYFANLFIKRFRLCCGIEDEPMEWKSNEPKCGHLPQMEYICKQWQGDLKTNKDSVLAPEEVTFKTLLDHNKDAAQFVLGSTNIEHYINNFEK